MTLPPTPPAVPDGPLAVAVTGHQDLGAAAPWVSDVLLAAVQIRQPIRGLSSLARGADQLFADAVVRTGGSLYVVVPCEDYEATFSSAGARAEYDRLLAAAQSQTTLSFPEPSEGAFWAAGQRLVNEADVVVAVWDGQPAAGLGGTADVVRYALDKGRPVLRLDPITRTVSWLTHPPHP